jgi:hypothetical protein
MALLQSDNFSLYNTSTLASKVKGWTNSSSSINYLQTGRWGAGSYSMLLGISTVNSTKTMTMAGSTTILGIAFSSSTNTTGVIASFTINSVVVSLDLVTSGSGYNLRVRNQTASTTYFTSSTVYVNSTFYYVELKIIWGTGGTGRIVLRVDNVSVYDSGVTLSTAAANGTVQLTLGASSGGAVGSYTDLLFMDGSGTTFNDFQGDVRIETLSPSSDGSNTSWSLPNDTLLTSTNQSRMTTSTSGWAMLTGTVSLARTATGGPDTNKLPAYLGVTTSTTTSSIISSPNGTSGYPVTPGQTLGFGVWEYSTPSPVPTVSARFYDSGGTQVGSDLSFGTLPSVASVWQFSNVTTSTVTVPANAVTCAIIISFTSTVSTQYRLTGFVLSTTTTTPVYIDPGNAHYMEVNDAIDDDDTTYLKSSTLNAKETFAMSDMASTGTILAVRPLVIARKETSGPTRTVATMVRIGGTDYVNANNQTVPGTLAYTPFSDTLAVSPATGTTWTKTEVNGVEAGIDITL